MKKILSVFLAGLCLAQAAIASAASAPAAVQMRDQGIVLWRAPRVVDGQLLVVELQTPVGCDMPTLLWNEQAYKPYYVVDRFQALLPVPLGIPPGELLLQVECGEFTGLFPIEVVEGSYAESKLRVAPKFSDTPPPPRAITEQTAIEEAFKTSAQQRLWSQPFVSPGKGKFTSSFGLRRTYNGVIENRHKGVDLDARVGAPVYASNDGVVALAAEDYFFCGNSVFIDHGDNLFSMVFHLSRIDVKTGEAVKRGQLIGLAGATGRVTGPHIHFSVKLAGTYISPLDMLDFRPGQLWYGKLTAH